MYKYNTSRKKSMSINNYKAKKLRKTRKKYDFTLCELSYFSYLDQLKSFWLSDYEESQKVNQVVF